MMLEKKWKRWLKAAGVRALKTFCQTLVTLIGADFVSITMLNWPTMSGIALTTALVSLLTSVAGIPEVSEGQFSAGE